jgi:hypothetical protein
MCALDWVSGLLAEGLVRRNSGYLGDGEDWICLLVVGVAVVHLVVKRRQEWPRMVRRGSSWGEKSGERAVVDERGGAVAGVVVSMKIVYDWWDLPKVLNFLGCAHSAHSDAEVSCTYTAILKLF